MIDSAPHKHRVPHWSWFLLATALLGVGFAGLCFAIPIYKQYRLGVELRASGLKVLPRHLSGLPPWVAQFRVLVGAPANIIAVPGVAKVTHQEMLLVAQIANLKGLYLDQTGVGDAELVDVGDLKQLTMLDLSGNAIPDASLSHLSGLTNIIWLSLGDTSITDDGLIHLAGLRYARTLILEGTKISDAGLSHLAGLTDLRFLDIRRTPVTPAGVAKLQAALPGCQIVDR